MNLKINLSKKNIIIISIGVAIAVIAAVLCAVLLLKGAKKATEAEPVTSSSLSVFTSVPEPVVSSEPQDNGIRLLINVPEANSYTTTEPVAPFSGTSDPTFPLTMNGNPVERNELGNFSFEVALNVGNNTFTFEHKGEVHVCNVNYRYVVINGYDPSTAQTYSSGSTFAVTVLARAGSNVTTSFNGETIQLIEQKSTAIAEQETPVSETFNNFSGSFSLPSGNSQNINLGKIKYTATFNGVTESFSSGNITVKKSSIIKNSDPAVTPAGGQYVDVGSGLIATIIRYNAETFDSDFDGSESVDWSRPTNNYLPEGTMDYCAEGTLSYKKNDYARLRCGKRVYLQSYAGKDYAADVISVTTGILPDHNEIGVASLSHDSRYTTLKLDCLWKAPFYFDLLNQSYTNPSAQDYTLSAVTYNYVDITFCYATVFTGEVAVPADNPLFERAEIIQNQYDYTLRLFLKRTGGFYGWDSYYDADGRLTFEFLNPAKLVSPGNLSGTRIFVDVGHGGRDPGAVGFGTPESDRNLNLALKLRNNLQALGATVIMSRDSDVFLNPDQQIQALKASKADFSIAIHHDSAGASANGFGAYHFNAFSKIATDFIHERTYNTGIYDKWWPVRFHYFYLARSTNCPVVLTENGFISNSYDHSGIVDEGTNDRKAQALAQGIVDYFDSIQ